MLAYFKYKWLLISKFLESKYFFYLILSINIVLMSLTKFYPTMDGAAHLYNTKLLIYLFHGNKFLNEFYTVNPIPIPNWISYMAIAIPGIALPIWLAEKIVIICYISAMAFSFRYFLKQTNPKILYISVLIFPFTYTILFYLGFYNFSISFIFLFLTLGYFIKNIASESFSNYLVLSIFITLCYFSNVLIYGFLGLTLGLITIQYSLSGINNSKSVKDTLLFIIRKLFWLFISSVPSLVFLFIFLSNTTFFTSNEAYQAKELIKWMLDVRSLIIYVYGDKILTQPFLVLLIALLIIRVTHKKTNNKKNFYSLALLILTFLSAVFYFLVPDGSGAGMMSYRFLIVFFFFVLLWVASIAVHNKMNSVILIIAMSLHIGLLFKHLNGKIRKLNHHAELIFNASSHIESNKIILPVNLSDQWMEPNFSNYLGLKKPVLILENYEAGVGWFPIKWKLEQMPDFQINGKSSFENLHWITNPNSLKTTPIDYIFIYGDLTKLKEEKWDKLNITLTNNFELEYESPEGYVLLYKSK